MDNLWTWKGKYFGYKDDNYLYTHEGKCVGQFYDNEIYGKDGHYLGELRNTQWLIVNKGKGHQIRPPFAHMANRGGVVKYADYAGFAMFAGCEDFPLPGTF